MMQNTEKWLQTWRTQQELSNEYQHDRVYMVCKGLWVVVLWTKVASALEGLTVLWATNTWQRMCHLLFLKYESLINIYILRLEGQHVLWLPISFRSNSSGELAGNWNSCLALIWLHHWIPISGLAWSLYKCVVVWRDVYGASTTEGPPWNWIPISGLTWSIYKCAAL